MSDDLILTELFQVEQAELERRLAAAMLGVGREIKKRPEILRGIAAADQLKSGYVVADEAQAAELADLVAQVIEGERSLTSGVNEAARIPKSMMDALRGSVESVKDRLAAAKQVGNRARVEYQNTLRRRAAEEAERQRQEAERAAREAAAAAEATGEDVPPMAEIAPPEVPRTVAGGMGKMGTMVRVEPVEIVDFSKVPREWLKLDPIVARAEFRALEVTGRLKRPEPGGTIVVNGVLFEAKETAVNRR